MSAMMAAMAAQKMAAPAALGGYGKAAQRGPVAAVKAPLPSQWLSDHSKDAVDPLVQLMKVEKTPDSTYEMIGGVDKQIKEIKEVIELPIKHPEIFESLGISQPKGVLLYGPPGTGKTLLARAVAHHTNCCLKPRSWPCKLGKCFIRVSGGELVQKYIGEGWDVDSIGSSRVEGESGGDSEVQRTMLELATNRIDILDDALLRPGRIDRKVEFPNPNEEARPGLPGHWWLAVPMDADGC
eukprot:Skav225945  [mRNA]  locus=scaffold1500:559830:570383:- [translate_table: standard]